MRIGIASLGRVAEDTGGRNYLVHFVEELVRQHPPHEFVLFLSEGEHEALGLPSDASIRVITIPNSKRTPLHKVIGEQIKLSAAIRLGKIDVMYYPGNFVALTSRTPAVLAIRSAAHFYGAKYGIRGVRRIVRSLLMPPSARNARAIITPSDDIKQDVIRFTGAPASKIHVIPHGVDLALFDGDQNRMSAEGLAVLSRFGLAPKSYLLYASALWRYKNQDQLIRAHAILVAEGYPHLKLVLAGKGTGTEREYIASLHSLTRSLGTEDLVIFTGGLAQQDLRYLYAHARAFVFPSSYESFGNPIFEAWASGVPVATANVHSFPEIVGDAGLLFDPTSVEDIARTLRLLLEDDALATQLIARGAHRAEEFTWSRTVERTLRLIENVSNSRPKME
ncbi:MAG: glycosyltransferase family 1 protein [Bacteroidota bacterium]|nr:glycosyltransferase family 1 protein [Bacteroidota bacterium]MDP4234724.1 glycosyltransferase family 1 protein [Bacteroidota bacterium]MDP4243947.1 glycosyltransferase family 1 protein [Bacteroidota bacterium]MDP4288830.1 glycosyltransferase family 1 protein [Bacteroidota bacterium]